MIIDFTRIEGLPELPDIASVAARTKFTREEVQSLTARLIGRPAPLCKELRYQVGLMAAVLQPVSHCPCCALGEVKRVIQQRSIKRAEDYVDSLKIAIYNLGHRF